MKNTRTTRPLDKRKRTQGAAAGARLKSSMGLPSQQWISQSSAGGVPPRGNGSGSGSGSSSGGADLPPLCEGKTYQGSVKIDEVPLHQAQSPQQMGVAEAFGGTNWAVPPLFATEIQCASSVGVWRCRIFFAKFQIRFYLAPLPKTVHLQDIWAADCATLNDMRAAFLILIATASPPPASANNWVPAGNTYAHEMVHVPPSSRIRE